MQAANNPKIDLDDEPEIIFIRRWLMPAAVVGSVFALALAAWALSL